MSNPIPHETIRTLAKSIHKEASNYGFQRKDMLRLVGEILDLCTKSTARAITPSRPIPGER